MSAAQNTCPVCSACSGNELLEDCLISILRKTEGQGTVDADELSVFMGIGAENVRLALSHLSKEGKVALDGSEASLTETGLMQAREIRKKHHVMENFLINVLGMDRMAAHKEAHQMEHSMTQESMQKLCSVTGNRRDSDCSACNNPCSTTVSIGTMESLHEMDVRDKGRIAFLQGKNPDDVKKLISMGFVPGREICVESRISSNGPRVVSMGESTVAVDAELSKVIMVNVGA